MTMRTLLIGFAAVAAPTIVHAAPKSAAPPVLEDESCSAAHVRAQVLKRDTPDKLLERRATLRTCASTPCARSIVQACSGWLQDVEAVVPSLVVRVVDGRGAARAGSSLSIDGKAVTPGMSVDLDPGEHTITAAVGTSSESRNVLLRSGEKGRELEIVIAVDTTPVSNAATRSPIFIDSDKRTVPATAWISYGIGAAGFVPLGLGLGLVFANIGTLGKTCRPDNTCPSSVGDEVHAYQTGRLLIGIGSVVVIAGAVVGTVLLLEGRPARQQSARLTLLANKLPFDEATP